MFGKINVRRALDFNYDIVEKRPPICAGENECKQNVYIVKTGKFIKVTWKLSGGSEEFKDIELRNVLRMTRSDDGSWRLVLRNTEKQPGERYWSVLENVRIKEDEMLLLKPPHQRDKDRAFPIASIKEYVACSFQCRPPLRETSWP